MSLLVKVPEEPLAERFEIARSTGRRAADRDGRTSDPWSIVRIVLIVFATFGALWVAFELETVLLLLMFSALFAYLVCPLVSIVERWLMPRGPATATRRGTAIAITYVLVSAAVVALILWIAPQVTDAAREVPGRLSANPVTQNPIDRVYDWLHVIGISDDVIQHAVTSASSGAELLAGRLAGTFVYLASFLPWLVLIPILAFFFLKDDRLITQAVIGVLPQRWQADAPEVLRRIDAALAGYVRAQLFACVIIGTLVGVGLAVLRVPFAAVLGVGSGLAEFLPIVGPLVIGFLAAGVAALRSPFLALWVVVFLAALRVAEDYVIYPRLIGSRVHLHPLAVVLAVLAGGELGGVVGVLLAVPALAIASAIYRYITLPVLAYEVPTEVPRADSA